MRNAFMAAFFELAKADKNIMLLTGDLGFGVFEAFQQKFPKQFLNVGVAEQNMMGIASGLALEGKTVFTYSIGNFPTLRCLEQIRNDACYHELNINIVASGGGFSYGGLGMSHHATEDIAIMRALPKTTVIAPSTAWEAGEATRLLAKTAGVGYLRIDKSAVAENGNFPPFQIGKAMRLREGSDVTIFGYGGILQEAMLAAEKLSNLGISCRVSSLHTVKPIDVNEIVSACKETQGIITIEEHILNGGLGGAIAEVCMDKGLKTNFFVRMGMQDEYSAIVGDQQYLRNYYHIDASSIINSIKLFLGES
jgi:transketolase